MYSLPSLTVALAALGGLATSVDATKYTNSSGSGSAPVVDLGYVKYTGYTNHTAGITYFNGIKYAEAPIGQRRWQPPVPVEQNTTYRGQTINATAHGPLCYQSNPGSLFANVNASGFYLLGESMPQSEDCLLLDILKPEKPSSNFLPVLVQIHGGGYTTGGAGFYPGAALVNRSAGELIYVDIQYRLGVHGFLSGSEVREDGVANAGLLDQRAALDWVQRNIRAFGGNPSQVTIWGGSAGGGSVTLQMTANGGVGTPPFSAAIAEYPWWQPLLNQSSQEIQYRNTLRVANCSSLACLRSLSSEALASVGQLGQNSSYAQMSPGDGYGDYYYGPIVDGTFVPSLPSTSFDLGTYHKVPLLVDRDAYEGFLFTNQTQTLVTAETMDAEVLFPSAGPSFFSRLYGYYPRTAYNSTLFQRQAWFGDFIINCPTYYMGSSAVNQYANNSQVWKLIFAAGAEVHGATGAFLTSNTTTLNNNNQTIGDWMTHWWISFAVNHDPNVGAFSGAPYWPSYVSGGNDSYGASQGVGFNTLQINYASTTVERDPEASSQCDFFGSNEYVVRN